MNETGPLRSKKRRAFYFSASIFLTCPLSEIRNNHYATALSAVLAVKIRVGGKTRRILSFLPQFTNPRGRPFFQGV
jgi:hypothetical protein